MQSVDDSNGSGPFIADCAWKPALVALLALAARGSLDRNVSWSRFIHLALWIFLWTYRCKKFDPTAHFDCSLLLGLVVWSSYTELHSYNLRFWDAMFPVWTTYLIVRSAFWLKGLFEWCFNASLKSHKSHSEPVAAERHGRPMLFPCRTTHSRMFPEKHSFGYSYLYVGVPVGWRGCSGSMLSVDTPKGAKRGWFHVQASDFLERGGDDQTLDAKLSLYLNSQVVPSSKCPVARLTVSGCFGR